MASGTKEVHFEEHIVKYLVDKGEYHFVDPKAYDKDLCLIPHMVIDFIKDTQPKQYRILARQYSTSVNEKIVQNLSKNLSKYKTLDVLRNGFKDRRQRIKLDFFNTNNSKDNIRNKFFEEIDSELLNFFNTKFIFYNKITNN